MKKPVLSLVLALTLLWTLGTAARADTGVSHVAANAWPAGAVGDILMGGPSSAALWCGGATRAALAVMLHYWRSAAAPTPSEPPQSPHPGAQTSPPTSTPKPEEQAMPNLTLQVGSSTFTVTLEESDTTRAFVARLPMTVTMGDLNRNEKYFYLTEGLPTDSQRPGTIRAGDLMLYGSDCLVLFYETFSSGYSYTPMGRVDDPSGLAAALGRGEVEVHFEAEEPA